MTDKALLRIMAPNLGREVEAMLPSDCACVLLLGVKGSGEQLCVSNIPAPETRAWLGEASRGEAQVGTIKS